MNSANNPRELETKLSPVESPDEDTAGQQIDFSLVGPGAENSDKLCLDF